MPHQLPERGPHVLLHADHGGDGVPRDAEDRLAVEEPEAERAARLLLHLPEDLPRAEVDEDRLDEVVVADRDPAVRHDDVGGRPRLREGRRHGLARVGDAGNGNRHGAEGERPGRTSCGCWSRGSARGPASSARRDELVARRQDRDPGARVDGDLGEADGGEDAERGGGEGEALREELLPLAEVLAGEADVRALLHRSGDPDAAPFRGRRLDRDDAVGPGRERRAGHDPDRGAGAHGAPSRRFPPGGRRGRRGRREMPGAAPAQSLGPNGVAVHRGVRERRDRLGGDDAVGEDEAEGVEERRRPRGEAGRRSRG